MKGIQINVGKRKGRLISWKHYACAITWKVSRKVRDQKLRLEVFSNPSHDILRLNTVILQELLPLFQVESTKSLVFHHEYISM